MINLTERDFEIMRTVTHNVRCLSVAQIARTWWGSGPRAVENAQARLDLLEEARYLKRCTMACQPELPLYAPVQVWEPGDATPKFSSVSYALQSRWKGSFRRQRVYAAAEITGRRFAAPNTAHGRPLQGNHDLHLAAVYLRFRQDLPEVTKRWVSEDSLPLSLGRKTPDAVIFRPDGRTVETVVEFGGSYREDRVRDFHVFCEMHGYPYMLW